MKKMIQFLYVVCAALLLTMSAGCSSTGYSGSSRTYSSNYYNNSWDYDNDYRSGVHRNYNRSAAAARARSEGGMGRSGGGMGGRSGGGGRGGGGGRR